MRLNRLVLCNAYSNYTFGLMSVYFQSVNYPENYRVCARFETVDFEIA